MRRKVEELWTMRRASEETGFPVKTLRGWRQHDPTFPVVSIRGRVFFREADLNRWIEINKSKRRVAV